MPKPKRKPILDDIPAPAADVVESLRLPRPADRMAEFYGGGRRLTDVSRQPDTGPGAPVSGQPDKPGGEVVSRQPDTGPGAPVSGQPDKPGGEAMSRQPDAPTAAEEVFAIPLDDIVPDPDQPRQDFNLAKLEELAESIRSSRQIQPIVVRPIAGGKFMLIAGERRWRACMLLEKATILAVIRQVSPADAFELALVENVQRESLSCLEEARALARLVQMRSISQAEAARRVGVDRRRVSEKLSLLRLPPAVQALLSSQPDTFTEAHAVTLAQASEGSPVEALARRCASEGWTVPRLREAIASRQSGGVARPTLFENVRMTVNARGGFSLVVRARSRDEVANTIAELEAKLHQLRATFLAAPEATEEEVVTS